MKRSSAAPRLLLALLATAGCSEPGPSTLSPQVDPQLGKAGAGPDYEIIDLGTFGATFAAALAVTDAGVVYGRYGSPSGVVRSYRWSRQDGMSDLGDVDGSVFRVTAANNRGDLAGIAFSPSGVARPVAWLRGTGFVYLDDEDHVGAALDINERGQIVGVRGPRDGSGQNTGFIWSAQDGLRLLPKAGVGAQALAINNRGQVVGTTAVEGTCCNQGFLWSEKDGLTLIPNLGGWAFALDVNERGEVVGESGLHAPQPGDRRGGPGNPGQAPTHAFYWSAARGTVDLGTLGGSQSVAWAIDQRGTVFGWSVEAGSTFQRAMMWTPESGMVSLHRPGWRYSMIFDVNHQGMAVGEAGPTGQPGHAVIFDRR